MRKVLSMVMDRQQIVDVSYEGSTTLAALYWPSYNAMKPFTDLIDKGVYAAMLKPDLLRLQRVWRPRAMPKATSIGPKMAKSLQLELMCLTTLSS